MTIIRRFFLLALVVSGFVNIVGIYLFLPVQFDFDALPVILKRDLVGTRRVHPAPDSPSLWSIESRSQCMLRDMLQVAYLQTIRVSFLSVGQHLLIKQHLPFVGLLVFLLCRPQRVDDLGCQRVS